MNVFGISKVFFQMFVDESIILSTLLSHELNPQTGEMFDK